MDVTSTSRVNRSFVIDVYSAKRNCILLPLFEWDFVSILRLRLVVLAGKTIGCQSTYPIKHSRPVVKSFGIGIGFGCSHVSTHFVVVSQSEVLIACFKSKKGFLRQKLGFYDERPFSSKIFLFSNQKEKKLFPVSFQNFEEKLLASKKTGKTFRKC